MEKRGAIVRESRASFVVVKGKVPQSSRSTGRNQDASGLIVLVSRYFVFGLVYHQ